MKTIFKILMMFCLAPYMASGQSDFDFSQRWFNESIYNPAATGNSFTTSIFGHLRKQWAGLEGAPLTSALAFDNYIPAFNSAIGGSVNYDKIGFTTSYNFRGSYAYYFPVSEKSSLSVGLSAALMVRNRNALGALVDDLDDTELYYGNSSEFAPDFDFGVEYLGAFKIGAAVRHLIERKNDKGQVVQARNFWVYASSRYNLLQYLSVEPLLSYMYRQKIHRAEAGFLLYFGKTSSRRTYFLLPCYNDKFWIGGTYRFNDQYSLMAGMQLTEQLRLGYSFDHAVRNLGHMSKFGTHEIFVAWQFNRIFYKDPSFSCPAYKSPLDRDDKRKKLRMERLYYQFY